MTFIAEAVRSTGLTYEKRTGPSMSDIKPYPLHFIVALAKVSCKKHIAIDKRFLYLAVAVLASNGQNETVTFATCFKETPRMAAILNAYSQSRGLHWWHHKSKPVCLVLKSRLSGHFQRWWLLNERDTFRITMPRSTRRKRCLSIEEDDSLPHYSKYRCMDREHSSHAESRHSKRYSTRSRSHDRRRRTRHCSRSHSARRSERKSKRQKHRYEHSNLSTVRKKKVID